MRAFYFFGPMSLKIALNLSLWLKPNPFFQLEINKFLHFWPSRFVGGSVEFGVGRELFQKVEDFL
jgi:hypothetical protein